VCSFLADTPTQSLSPLVDSSVSDAVIKVAPLLNKSFFQMTDVMDPATVDALAKCPRRVVNQIDVGLFGGQ